MMMALGQFVFSMGTVPYQDFRQSLAWRHPANSRVGKRPAHQFVGPDEETITLSGAIFPEMMGGEPSLAKLRDMADTGGEWPLVEGTGRVFGVFVINSLEATRTEFFPDGAARKIEFSLNLTRVDDAVGMLTSA